MADFGQTDFGQFFDPLWPIVGLVVSGQTNFGQHLCFSVLAKFSTHKAETLKTQLDPKPSHTQTLDPRSGHQTLRDPTPFGHARIWPKPQDFWWVSSRFLGLSAGHPESPIGAVRTPNPKKTLPKPLKPPKPLKHPKPPKPLNSLNP